MATKQLANSSFRSLGISGVENAARGAKGAVTFLAAWCSLGQFDADAYRSLGPVTVDANSVEVLKGDQSYLEAVFRGAQSVVDKSQIPMTIKEGEPHLLPSSAQKHYSSLSGAFNSNMPSTCIERRPPAGERCGQGCRTQPHTDCEPPHCGHYCV